MSDALKHRLSELGIRASAHRLAVAEFVLNTDSHPAADEVWLAVRGAFPSISRATVYNTLHLFVEAGLLRRLEFGGGKVVYDPHVEDHHHFIEDETGRIHDIPWGALDVSRVEQLPGFDVREYQVVMRGHRTPTNAEENES